MSARNRRASDIVSGLELKREEWSEYSDEDIVQQFGMFKCYDLDNSGFITPANMFDVLLAMEVAGVTIEKVHAIIEEVAILTGHDNDGKLSFRDFMAILQHDHRAKEQNDALDAAQERRLSMSTEAEALPVGSTLANEEAYEVAFEPEAQSTELAHEPEPQRARRSSMGALNMLASNRIKAFQQVADEATARDKLNKFKAKPVELSGPMVNSDDMHKETLQNKLKAFEVAATYKGKVEVKTTWKKIGGASNYASGKKLLVGGMPAGVAPKKKLSELP